MTDRDPTRWSERGGGAPAELQQLLSTARHDVPDDEEMKAMGLTVRAITAACIGGAVAGGAGGGALAGAKATTSAAGAAGAAGTGGAVLGTTAAKIGAGLLLVGGATFGTWSATRDVPPQEPPTHLTPAVVAPAAEEVPDVAPKEVGAEEPTPEPTEPAAEGDDPATEQAPTLSDPSKQTSAHKKQAPSEVSLLKAAQRALRDDPARAMSLVRQHQQLYPSGQLIQEREVIRIKALEQLGRQKEANQAEKKFEQNFPDSAHRSKLLDERPANAGKETSTPSQ